MNNIYYLLHVYKLLNTFGKFYCLADGNIYSNLDVDALGDIYTLC